MMEIDIELNLAEAARELGTSVQKLIQFGGHGILTISVIANEWPVDTNSKNAEAISGLVNLVPSDLQQSYAADFVLIHKVVAGDKNETATLAKPVEVLLGPLYVTAAEFRRFRDKHGGAAGRIEVVPPYLDPNHNLKSPHLAIAINAWLALFATGEFDAKGRAVKQRIEEWLTKNHGELSTNARENIATLINPKIYKHGGTPPTPSKKT